MVFLFSFACYLLQKTTISILGDIEEKWKNTERHNIYAFIMQLNVGVQGCYCLIISQRKRDCPHWFIDKHLVVAILIIEHKFSALAIQDGCATKVVDLIIQNLIQT